MFALVLSFIVSLATGLDVFRVLDSLNPVRINCVAGECIFPLQCGSNNVCYVPGFGSALSAPASTANVARALSAPASTEYVAPRPIDRLQGEISIGSLGNLDVLGESPRFLIESAARQAKALSAPVSTAHVAPRQGKIFVGSLENLDVSGESPRFVIESGARREVKKVVSDLTVAETEARNLLRMLCEVCPECVECLQ